MHLEGSEIFLCWWKAERKTIWPSFYRLLADVKTEWKSFSLSTHNSHHGRPLWTINSRRQSSYSVPHSISGQENKQVGKMREETQTFRFWNIMLPLQGWVRTDVWAHKLSSFQLSNTELCRMMFGHLLTLIHCIFPLIWQLPSLCILSQLIRKKNLIKP